MWPDRASNSGPLTYESDVLPTALRGPADKNVNDIHVCICVKYQWQSALTDGQETLMTYVKYLPGYWPCHHYLRHKTLYHHSRSQKQGVPDK